MVFDLATEVVKRKTFGFLNTPRRRLRRDRKDFHEAYKMWEEAKQIQANARKIIAEVKSKVRRHEEREAEDAISEFLNKWNGSLEILYHILKDELVIEYLTIHPLDHLGEWLTKLKHELQEFEQRMTGKTEISENTKSIYRLIEKTEKSLQKLFDEKMVALKQEYNAVLRDKQGQGADVQTFVVAIDQRMKASNELYALRSEVRKTKHMEEEVDDEVKALIREVEAQIENKGPSDLTKTRNLAKHFESSFKNLEENFERMLHDFQLSIILVASFAREFKLWGEQESINLLNDLLESGDSEELQNRLATLKRKLLAEEKDLLGEIVNISRRAGRIESAAA